jgi:hypothetical protein
MRLAASTVGFLGFRPGPDEEWLHAWNDKIALEPQDVVAAQVMSHEMKANYSTVITCPSTDAPR